MIRFSQSMMTYWLSDCRFSDILAKPERVSQIIKDELDEVKRKFETNVVQGIDGQ